jgi:hypothetical protein
MLLAPTGERMSLYEAARQYDKKALRVHEAKISQVAGAVQQHVFGRLEYLLFSVCYFSTHVPIGRWKYPLP